MPICPKCGSTRVQRYTPHALTCDSCGHDGRSDEFAWMPETAEEAAEAADIERTGGRSYYRPS